MRLEVIQSLKAVEALSDEWNDLLSCCSASHVPFLRNEYLAAWWKTLGGGEWQHGELFVITAHDEDGGLVGIAPLFFTQNLQGEPALMLIGSIEISDYLDLIVRGKVLPQFMDQLLDLLASDQAPPWKVLDLYNLPDYSPTLATLQACAEKRDWIYQQQALQKSPYITLPGDWETYLAGIDKKQRHEIRRKMRRAEESEVPVRWYIVEDKTTLDHETEEFLTLMAQDPEKERFLTPTMRTQMRLAVQAAFKGG